MSSQAVISNQSLENKIILIRKHKVMIDRDIAVLFGVPTKALNQAVKRNQNRFPSDFMFRLTKQEKDEVVTICDHLKALKFSPALPNAFTEHGILMVANVLNSPKAIAASIWIVRVFIQLRGYVMDQKEIILRLKELEQNVGIHDQQIAAVFEAIRKLMAPPPEKKKRPISIFSAVQKISNPYGERSFDIPGRKMFTLNKAPSLVGGGFIVDREGES